jgi:hypothetical protein
MGTEIIPKRNQVGIAVRFKDSPSTPAKGFGHVDVIGPMGRISGFYGKGDGVLGSASGASGFIVSSSLVMDYALLKTAKKEYVDIEAAKAKKCKTTIVMINTDQNTASVVDAFWPVVREEKGAYYNLWGGNCSSYAFACFAAAGILDDESILDHFTDTPDKLYETVSRLPQALPAISGYVGFFPLGADSFKILIE